jgi:tripartite-type tricarboxylate transporter receptor subunit TctC
MPRNILFISALLGILEISFPETLHAQSYPSKPVKVLVGISAGGAADLTARFVAHRLSSTMGQQFIVENKPGAGGTIAFATGINSTPDGYTLTLITMTYTISPSVYKLKFDPVGDMTPIVQICQGPQLIVAHPSLPVTSIRDLIALAKSKPGKLNYASPGQGSTAHLTVELFSGAAGIKMNHIPYKGAAQALTDTVAGQTDLAVSSLSGAYPYVKSGRLRALAVTTPERVPAAPDIPTVAESGVPGFEVIQWFGLIGPKGLPLPIVASINGEVAKLLKSKEAAEHLQNEGMSPVGGTPEQFLALIKKEIPVWRKVAADIGLKAD